jgi:hypothetical protein
VIRPSPLAFLLLSLLVVAGGLAAQQEAPDVVRLVASDAEAGDLFGCAFDLFATNRPNSPGFGGTLLVGSLGDDDRGDDSGAVYLFELTSDGWLERAKGLADEGSAGDLLGYDVVLGRGAYLAGAPGANGGRGRLVLFRGPDQTGLLAQVAVLEHPDDEPGAGFGTSLAVGSLTAENVVVAVGAPGADDDRGAVYLVGQGRNSLGEGSALRPPESARRPGDGLGWAVAITGDWVVAGAPWADAPLTDSGAVHLFSLSGQYLESILAPDGLPFDAFGYALAADADRVAVGAPRSDLGGPGSGAVYVYTRSANPRERLRLDDVIAGEPGDQLGVSVAFDGFGRLLAGGRNADGRAGVVRRYARGETSWFPIAPLRFAEPGDELGIAVAADRDLFAVGAYRDDTGGVDAGAVWVTEPPIFAPPTRRTLAPTSTRILSGGKP